MSKNVDEKEKVVPAIGSVEWQDFVVSELTNKELSDGSPTAAGLRRVCELHYGNIIDSNTEVIQFPNKEINRAVVRYTVRCIPYQDKTNASYSPISVAACAESNESNLDSKFFAHMVATAETRAEGRALKKLMCLNFSTAEELIGSSNADNPEMASEVKCRAIKKMCDNLELNIGKFLAKYAEISATQLENRKTLSKAKAESLLSILNDFSNDKTKIPGDVK